MTEPAPPTAPAPAATFGGVCPIFRVADLDAAVAYYVERLGFAVDWHYPGSIASVTRGAVSLFLCANDQGTPVAWAWVGVSDAEALHEELRARGATIRQPPANFEWALELQVEDPDGNVLRLGSAPKPGVAYGPWKDMNGVLWYPTEAGGWSTKVLDTAGAGTAGAETAGVDTAGADTARTTDSSLEPGAGSDAVFAPAPPAPAVSTPAVSTPAVSTPASPAPAVPALSAADRGRQLRADADAMLAAGESARARTLYEQAARAYEEAGDRAGLAVTAGWAARLAWRAHNDLARAREWLAVARRASDATSDPAVWKLVREIGLELGG